MSDDEIIKWAYEFFGLDCCPLIEERDGELCLGITDTKRKIRYGRPMAELRAGLRGRISDNQVPVSVLGDRVLLILSTETWNREFDYAGIEKAEEEGRCGSSSQTTYYERRAG